MMRVFAGCAAVALSLRYDSDSPNQSAAFNTWKTYQVLCSKEYLKNDETQNIVPALVLCEGLGLSFIGVRVSIYIFQR